MNDPLFPAQAAARAPSEAALRADAEQREASDPRVSAFVSASAGSGKTKLLTDRLLRLMLDGADPRRIQCLTFTRAAAAEMSLRLQDRLGRWVTMGDVALGDALADLGVPVDEARLRRARALFALVLDLPGGMRIGTIHAFCQSLLRRFPLEAGISPHFQLVEEGEARLMLEEAREQVLTAAPPISVALIAEAQRAEGFGSLVGTLNAQRDRMGWLLGLLPAQRRNTLRRALGVSARSEEELLLDAVSWPGEAEMRGAVRLILAHGTDKAKENAATLDAWLATTQQGRVEHWGWWQSTLLTAEQNPRTASAFASKPLRERHPEIVEAITAEQERLLVVLDQRRAVQLVEASSALLDLAVPVLQRYAQRKREGGLLDYADMIGHTAMLLRDPGAAWVLYKLDGGLDHLLLDEVQDTSPEQWRIAHVLTEEFFAGIGRDEDRPRTFFAVGDPKQSIYSFQGADPDEFDRSHAQMASRVRDAGQDWRDVPLDVSFRSTAPVLALVDAVFADAVAAHGVVSPGARPLKHFANRIGDAGRVELWPLQPRPEARERVAWEVAERNEEQPTAQQALATELARWIKGQLNEGVLLPSQGRPLEAGDVLVLVQRRGTFAPALVRALKVAGVPVAGLDRLALREQLAVQDLLALCDALLLPGDDLQLACVLTSPLGGLSDDRLMDLALRRPGSLWEALRLRAPERRVWADALRFLDALHARADFATPHALLSEALGPLGGRARLLRRLGPEAAEPIDELLNAALAYAGAHPPSLQGFVHWMRASSEEVQRQAEELGSLVRVMTVHGAKGLQARLVILPDTTGEPPRGEPFVWLRDRDGGGSVPVWVPRVAMRSERVHRALEREADEDRAERNRLLYVALTRAQDRLVVCGWEPARSLAPESWHAMVRRGFERLGARVEPFTALAGDWAGERLVVESAQRNRVPPPDVPARQMEEAPLPTWAGRAPDWRPIPPAPEPQPAFPIAASRPEGIELGVVPRTVSPLAAREGVDPFLHGRLVHTLLQNLPDLPPGERPEAARAYAARPGFGLPRAEARRVVEEALGVLADPSLAPLFGPGSRAEQPLVGVVNGAVVSGIADRLAVLPSEVLVADYKTDRDPPERAEDTPALYLGQLAAYQALLAAAFPDRPVRCILVWTRAGHAMRIPDALLAAHRPHA